MEPLLEPESEVAMDAIRIHPGLFTDGNYSNSIFKTPRPKNNISRVGDRQYRFNESTLLTYPIHVDEKQATNMVKDDIGLFFDNRDWIAIKPTRKGRKGGSERICKRAHWVR